MVARVATAQPAAAAFPVPRRWQTLGLSRATSERWQGAAPVPAQDMAGRAQSQALAGEMPAYGSRRIADALPRRGCVVNHPRGRRKRSCVRTTASAPPRAVYPHLRPPLTVHGRDQLWGAAMTAGRLPQAFVDLAVLLDAYRRRCMGGALEHYLDAERALAARRPALATRAIRPGLVHHADRGGQYASQASTNLLKAHGIRSRMSRTGTPSANAPAERFIKPLQYAEVHLCESHNVAAARARIGPCSAAVSNDTRLHAALGDRPPAECERWRGSSRWAELVVSP